MGRGVGLGNSTEREIGVWDSVVAGERKELGVVVRGVVLVGFINNNSREPGRRGEPHK